MEHFCSVEIVLSMSARGRKTMALVPFILLLIFLIFGVPDSTPWDSEEYKSRNSENAKISKHKREGSGNAKFN